MERTEKYRVAPAYRLGNETDIMYEIYKSGPVQGEKLKRFTCLLTVIFNIYVNMEKNFEGL